MRDILAHHTGPDVTVNDHVINSLLGLSGADLANIARDAKGRARRRREAMTAEHLLAASVAAVPFARDSDLRRINERLKSAEALAVQTLTEKRALLEEVADALMVERELDICQIRVLTDVTNGTLPPSQMQEGLVP